ncbi:neurocan core [Brachionus plicatilis]|uniref:Neurocan core n=1 Tax=Brachionus plicatilis TaxID=10195 RepID=A0A3M7R8S1_BRAPC|nr:neurocan core [Brachionus plicatilis]
MKILIPLLLVLYNGRLSQESNNAGWFQLVKGKNFPFHNFSLVPNHSPLKLSKIICFRQCLRNEFCSFVVFQNNICSLHTKYALSRLVVVTNMKVVFQKKFIIDSPCINGANCVNKLNGYLCICKNGFFGTNCEKNISSYSCPTDNYRLNETDSCKPCMAGFTTFNSYPFNCYKLDGNRNYESAKLFCQSLNSFLWRPKTLTELNFLNDLTWAESKITYVGQPFVWPDGSIVYNFDENEPNNSGGGISSLRENASVSQDSMLVDSNFENVRLFIDCSFLSSFVFHIKLLILINNYISKLLVIRKCEVYSEEAFDFNFE